MAHNFRLKLSTCKLPVQLAQLCIALTLEADAARW